MALASCAVLAAVVTGCGSASASGPGGASQSPAGSFAEKILGGLKLPTGAKAVTLAHPPSAVRDPWAGTVGAVDLSRMFAAPASLMSAETFLVTHSPPDAATSGSGSETGPGGAVSRSVYFRIGNLPHGISDADVQIYMVPGTNSVTVIAAYVHVAGQPSKTPAEHLDASRLRAVVIRVDGKATRTFTSWPVVARLTAALNVLPAAGTGGAHSCFGSATSYTLTFEPASASETVAVVDTYSCGADTVTAEGIPQPALADPNNTVAAMAAQLTNTKQFAS